MQEQNNALQAELVQLKEELAVLATTGTSVDAPRSDEMSLEGAPRRQSDRIDINAASATELEELPGIGATKATAIIEYRQTHGPFTTAEELLSVKGIGQKTFDALAPLIIVGR